MFKSAILALVVMISGVGIVAENLPVLPEAVPEVTLPNDLLVIPNYSSDPCGWQHHPLSDEAWKLPSPAASIPPCGVPYDPNCPVFHCLDMWFYDFRMDLRDIDAAWQDAWCNCECCWDTAGFSNKDSCIAAMKAIFAQEYQNIIDRYNNFDPDSCCCLPPVVD